MVFEVQHVSTLVLLILLPTLTIAAGGSAKVWLENHTNRQFVFQVLHQYTGKAVQSSKWIFVKPGEGVHMLDVTYNYGFLTTGVDNWKIHGNDGSSGKYWRAGHGYAADWKKHFLTAKDNGKWTYIKIYQDTVQFVSDSGNSETQWYINEGRGNVEPWAHAFSFAKAITGMVADVGSVVKPK